VFIHNKNDAASFGIRRRLERLVVEASWEREALRAELLVDTEPSRPRVIAASGTPTNDVTAWSTWLFGNGRTEGFLQERISITGTVTSSITASRIFSRYQLSNTSACIQDACSATGFGGSLAQDAVSSAQSMSTTCPEDTRFPGVGHVPSGARLSISSIGEQSDGHPTRKPVALMCELVGLFTDPSETILDPFAGSGTTGVACLRLGRRFVGVERDVRYFEIACERLRAEELGSTLDASRAGQLPLLGGSR
jgi:hypothetical protein